MLIAVLVICLFCFCVTLVKWYIYLENRGAIAIIGLTSIAAGFISGFIVGVIGAQFGRRYIVPSTFAGVIFGIFSYCILAILSTAYFRLFKPELIKGNKDK